MANARHLSTQTVQALREGWSVYLCEPDAVSSPDALANSDITPVSGEAPGTVVSAFQTARNKTLQYQSPDDFDVWYTCRFNASAPNASERVRLIFEGLATIADVWLNGEPILHSENMHLRHDVDITASVRPVNELCVRFASLNRFLEQRRARPQWRTHLVDHTQLRWVRTALAGRMPGWHQWAKTAHAVGPWRPISLVTDSLMTLDTSDIRATVDGRDGIVEASINVRVLESTPTQASLIIGDHSAPLTIQATAATDGGFTLHGEVRIPSVALWWPHTHGDQPLYPVRVQLQIGGEQVKIDFGRTGFRSLSIDRSDGGFSVSINGEPIFLRGANWNTLDSVGLLADETKCGRLLELARDAGMNMLRVSGTGSYESDFFYDWCAEMGITLWHDFAFAVMDYPAQDAVFAESVSEEANQLLARLRLNPSLTVLCGNSECEMGAAMHGLTAARWQNPLFDRTLAQAARTALPAVPYLPSSPTGGALPFQPDTGVSHYYGIGAFLKPPDDARRSHVRFAAECLGFSNIPEDGTIDSYLAPGECPGRQPSWKSAVPRNVSLGWDFDDVRDHYVRQLVGEDPGAASFSDMERYLTLGRLVNGELMTGAFAEWRRPQSPCRGALVWYFQDMWPGAGWGIVDSRGLPKSVYYALKRILSPVGLFFADEGLNGLRLHLINERPTPLKAMLRIALYRLGHICIHQQSVSVEIAPRSAQEINIDDLLGYFTDTTFAYRFGTPTQDVTVATLEMEDGISGSQQAFYFPLGPRFPRTSETSLQAEARPRGDGCYDVSVQADRFAQAVAVTAKGYLPSDNYFHLEPGHTHKIVLTPSEGNTKALSGSVRAANFYGATGITVSPDGSVRGQKDA